MSQPSSSSSSSFYVIDYEKQFLSAVIRTEGAVLADTPHITAGDFSETNRVVFNAIQSCLAGGSFNRFILVQKLNGLNIKIGGVIEPEIYINAIADLNGVGDRAAIEISKQIKQVTIRRELDKTIDDMKRLVKNSKDMKASELVAAVTGAFNAKVNVLAGSGDNDPQDLYGSIPDLLERENDFDANAIEGPYPYYTDAFGWYDAGQVMAICARAKTGKSTWVMSMLDQIMRKDEDFCALMLDTELTLDEVGLRLVSSLTNIKEYHVRRKLYKRKGNEEMKKKIEAAYALIKPFVNRIDHKFVGGMDLEEQMSIARRWVTKKRQQGKKCLLVYDYVKLDGVEFDSKQSRDIVLGKKANIIKNLAKELKIPIWTLVQAGRENEDTKAGGRISNGTVVAGSDMISQFFSNLYLLNRLSMDERVALNQMKETDATHALLPIYTRQLGPNETGQSCLVKYKETNPINNKVTEKYRENFILYSFYNFRVREVGTYKQLYEKAQITGVNVQPTPPPAAPNADGFTVL